MTMIDPDNAADRGDDFDSFDDPDDVLDPRQGDLLDGLDDMDGGEETDEEREEREAEEAARERDKRVRIPKERFDEAVNKERARADALQAKIDALERPQTRQDNAPSMADIQAHLDTLQDQYEELLIDGLRDDARDVRKQMTQIQNYVQDQKLQQAAVHAREGTLGTIKYETALAQLESQYPEINPDGDGFDADVATEVAELAQAFIAAGHSNVQALQRATRYVLGGKTTAATDVPAARTTAARARNASAAQRQPANTALTGRTAADRTGIDVTRLNQKAFSKLDEQMKSKLRGDEL